MSFVDYICFGCGIPARREKKVYNYNVKRGINNYCSSDCYISSTSNSKEYSCAVCSKKFKRSLSELEANVYCSRACAASVNARKNNRSHLRKITKYCLDCNSIISKAGLRCKACASLASRKNLDCIVYGDIKQNNNIYNAHAKVRVYARSKYNKSGLPKVCFICGYSKHYEICHIKPVKYFPDTATLGEINEITNLVALCPNCHWEFDHDLLTL